jgi:hypothetical protein
MKLKLDEGFILYGSLLDTDNIRVLTPMLVAVLRGLAE